MAAFEVGTFTFGSLLGLVLGAFLGHTLAIRRGKGLIKHNAAIELKKVITPSLDKLEGGEKLFGVIQESFDTHYQAAIIYSAYLTGRELQSFKSAVKNYKEWRNTMYGRSASEILYETEDPEYLRAKSINPVDLLNDIVKYANT